MISRLPNAPLTEVVFEMQWKMVENPSLPIPIDPGYPLLVDVLTSYSKKKGFDTIKDFHPGYTGFGRSISRRFYKGEQSFPLLQIGPGIFAANESIEYEWNSFKKMAADGASEIVRNYPQLRNFPHEILHLELRYLDTFEESLVGSSNILDFINQATESEIKLPSFWDRSFFKKEKRGRIQIDADVKDMPDSIFSINIASAKKDEVPVIRMESKVITAGTKLIATGKVETFSSKLDIWMEKAHEKTSESFKELIKPDVFEKFEKAK